eukprot:1701047-Pleurochrysis_carterae.AAC.3
MPLAPHLHSRAQIFAAFVQCRLGLRKWFWCRLNGTNDETRCVLESEAACTTYERFPLSAKLSTRLAGGSVPLTRRRVYRLVGSDLIRGEAQAHTKVEQWPPPALPPPSALLQTETSFLGG